MKKLRKNWTDAEIDEVLRRYPHERTADIAKDMGCTKGAISTLAVKSGVGKARKRTTCIDCGEKVYSKGRCTKHYQRQRLQRVRKEPTLSLLEKYHFEKGGRRAVRVAPPGWGYLEVRG